MKQLTKTKYDVKQLCAEELKVSVQTFRNNKQKYMDILEQDYHVTIEIGARNKEFYILEPKEKEMVILKDVVPNTTKLKRNDLKNIEAILKAVLIDNVLPIVPEIVEHTGMTESTVKRCMKKMRDNNILLEPETRPDCFINQYTGEIIDYEVKQHSFIYYDKLPSGKRVVLDYLEIHEIYSELYSKKMDKLYHEHKSNYNRKIALNVARVHAQKEVNSIFNLHNGNKTPRWIVDNEYRKLVEEKYR